jgi:hypothetical protein
MIDKNKCTVFQGKPLVVDGKPAVQIVTQFRGHVIGNEIVPAEDRIRGLIQAQTKASVITSLVDHRMGFTVVVMKRGDRVLYHPFLKSGHIEEASEQKEYLFTVKPNYD